MAQESNRGFAVRDLDPRPSANGVVRGEGITAANQTGATATTRGSATR